MVGLIIDLTDRASDLDRRVDFLDSVNGDREDLDVGIQTIFARFFFACWDFSAVGEMFRLFRFCRSWRLVALLLSLCFSFLSFSGGSVSCLVFCLGFSCCLVLDILVDEYIYVGR